MMSTQPLNTLWKNSESKQSEIYSKFPKKVVREYFFCCLTFSVIENTLSLPPISGAVRLNRESGANPGQFPLL